MPRAFLLAAVLSALAMILAPRPAEGATPNLVILLADDLGWGDLGCYNSSSKVPTPNLDQLAAEGLRFTDAHSPSAVCSPTRYGLLTGRYAWRTRLKSGVLWGYSPPLIDPSQPTLASFLQQQGYATACVGKWHLGLTFATRLPAAFGDGTEPKADTTLIDWSQPLPAGPHTVGFGYSFIIPASLDMVPYVFLENGRATAVPTKTMPGSQSQRQGGGGFWREGPAAPDFTMEGCLPTLARRAVDFLHRQSRQQPFFLYFPLTAPHDPWVPSPEYQGRSTCGPRGDFVAQVDAVVGQVLKALDDGGHARNTLFFFTSDNGAHWLPKEAESTGHAANGPWRGMKSDAFEGGHRVPLIARWPGRVHPGTTTGALVGLNDLFATVADVLHQPLPAGAAPDSVSFRRSLRGEAPPLREIPLVLHSIRGAFALRQGPWKLIGAANSGGWSPGAVETPGQLYHLGDDPAEQHNLWNHQPDTVARLQHVLAEIRDDEAD